MTPKEKATELVEKYIDIQSELEETTQFYWGYAVKSALIAVDEILNDLKESLEKFKDNLQLNAFISAGIQNYKEVKEEIQKL